jgi:hypothetical protein
MTPSSRRGETFRGVAPRLVLGAGAAAAVLSVATPSTAQDPRPLVSVSMTRSPGLAVLEARSTGGAWTTVCGALPCQLRLSAADEYRISGEGVVDSDVFRLPSAPAVRVDATGGSSLLHGIGLALTVGGLAFAAGGGGILLVPDAPHASDDARTSRIVVGTGFLVMGVVATAIGLAARIFSDTSATVTAAP